MKDKLIAMSLDVTEEERIALLDAISRCCIPEKQVLQRVRLLLEN